MLSVFDSIHKVSLLNKAAHLSSTLIITLLVAACLGCSKGDRPPLARVKGTVTIDGKPASGVGVVFSQTGYRSAFGMTNDMGEYELKYLKDVMGGVIGENRVRIESVATEGKGNTIRIPARYNRKSELTAIVESGRNTINFSLELSE